MSELSGKGGADRNGTPNPCGVVFLGLGRLSRSQQILTGLPDSDHFASILHIEHRICNNFWHDKLIIPPVSATAIN